MEPTIIITLIVSIISAFGVCLLSIIKVIKHSSCCYGCFDFEGKSEIEPFKRTV